MEISLKYGRKKLPVRIPGDDIVVIEPRHVPGLPNEHEAFLEAARHPTEAAPLREAVSARDTIAIVIPDITRPFPGQRIVPWLLEEIAHVPARQITIISGTGSHRMHTQEELVQMLGEAIVGGYKVITHDSYDLESLAEAGRISSGRTIHMNREYVRADKRILLGFVEPHLFAGFSGGYKAICPGVMGIDDILYYHRAELIAHPMTTWGVLEGNPTQALIRECGSLLPVDFCVNITMNRDKEITGIFAGQVMACHLEACRLTKETAMCPVSSPFDVIVATNGGYPADQNLYQTVKSMSAARQIASQGGFILSVSECIDGFPEHGNFKQLLFQHGSAQALLDRITSPGFAVYDQWEAQLLAMLACYARVGLYSSLDADDVRRAHLEPVSDIEARIEEEIIRLGRPARIAVLPEGPYTIPYLDPSGKDTAAS